MLKQVVRYTTAWDFWLLLSDPGMCLQDELLRPLVDLLHANTK